MSAFLLGVGFKATMGSRERKLVLLKLIDACDEDGTRIFPAVATIARAAECHARTVQRVLKEFIEAGLLHLVREGGKGRGSCNEYALDLDALFAISKHGWAAFVENGGTQDVVAKGDCQSPLKGGDGAGERVTDAPLRVTEQTLKGDSRSHTTPPEPSNTPPERERASADGEGEPSAAQDVPRADQPGTADFEKRVTAFCNGRGFAAGPWPDWDTSSQSWIGRQMAKLSPEERVTAERWRDAYLSDIAARGKRPVSPGVFLRDRMWDGFEPAVLERFEAAKASGKPGAERARPDGWAAAMGPVGMAWLLAQLLDGPADPDAAAAPAGRAAAASGSSIVWFTQDIVRAWPRAADFQTLVSSRGGHAFGERWHALKDRLEPVPAGSDTLTAWRASFDAAHWPWLPAFDKAEVVYLPKGGPDGLDAFAQALRGADDPINQEAAE